MNNKQAHIIHYCKEGNHYHILSDDEEYASPPFWSVSHGLAVIQNLVTFGISLEECFALQRKLLELAARKKTKSYKPLPLLPDEWDKLSNKLWIPFLKGECHWREMLELLFLTDIKCDFVRNKNTKSHDGEQLNLNISPLKVAEVGISV